jgi:toxin CcdB
MAQFDVYENLEPESKKLIPFLLDVQHDLHSNLNTRTIVPLVVITSPREAISKLCPILCVSGVEVMMSTPEIAGYPVADLKKKVMSASFHRNDILAAIDFLLNGF